MGENIEFRMTHDLRPAYYDDFQCIGGACRDSCCIGWNIPFSKNDYLRLKRLKNSPELEKRFEGCLKRIRNNNPESVSGYYAKFRLNEDGDCPLHREDGLCALQIEHGHEALPLVCTGYPRSECKEYYMERSLSPSCEAVLELLWNLPEGIDFRSDPLPEKECGDRMLADVAPLMRFYPFIREQCIDILQYRGLPLAQRILLMGFFLQKLEDNMGEQQVADWMGQIRAVLQSGQAAELAAALAAPEGTQTEVLAAVNGVQVLGSCEQKKTVLDAVRDRLLALFIKQERQGQVQRVESAAFFEARESFEKTFADCDYFFENLAVTVLFYKTIPDCRSTERLWKSYVDFCNVMSFYRFMAVMSCAEGQGADKQTLFRHLVYAGRSLLHNDHRSAGLREMLEQNQSGSLAHMAILLSL